MKPDELKEIRKEIGARQKDFAVVLGVALRTYQNWEQPKTAVNIARFQMNMQKK